VALGLTVLGSWPRRDLAIARTVEPAAGPVGEPAAGAAPDPAGEARLWLGIVCLATLRSPFAPMYTAVGTLWLLCVAAGQGPPRPWRSAAIAACWIGLQGFPPVFSDVHNVIASLPSQLATIAIAVIAVWPGRASRRAPAAISA
jgi:hypothetical protein